MRLDERIKFIATVTAAASFLIFGIASLVEPAEILVASAITSAIATIVFGAAWRIEAVPPVAIVITTMAMAIGAAATLPDPAVRAGAGLAVVTVSIIGIELVRRRHATYIAGVSVVLFGYPILAYADATAGFAVGTIGAAGFLLGALVLRAVSREREYLQQEQTVLLELAPALIVEADWTEAERRVKSLGIDDPDTLRHHLLEQPDLVAEIASTVEILAANQAARDAFGPEGPLGWRVDRSRVHAESVSAFADQLVSIADNRKFHDSEYATTRNDGSRVVLMLRSVVNRRHPGQTRLLVAAQDVTEHKVSQVRLQEALASKDAFIAEVSHELRTPLSAVVGLTSTVLEGTDLSAEDRELLKLVSEQAEEMAHIIDDLLVAARSDNRSLTVTRGPVDACVEAASVVAGSAAEVVCPPGPVLVSGDASRIRQIVRNLLTNAERYGEPPVRVEILEDGDTVAIAVSDAGPPIPTEHRDRIFEPYGTAHTTEAISGSIGLGLAVSRTLARLMGGELGYEHDGRSVFTLTLPAHIEEETVE